MQQASPQAEVSVLYGVPLAHLYRVEASGHSALGAAGLAVLGVKGKAVSPRHVLVYDAAKKPFLQEPLSPSFAVIPQPGNYATFYAASGGGGPSSNLDPKHHPVSKFDREKGNSAFNLNLVFLSLLRHYTAVRAGRSSCALRRIGRRSRSSSSSRATAPASSPWRPAARLPP